MNTAADILPKVDLLSFLCQSESRGATLRMTRTNDGTCANVISFPACGNWINKPVDPATMRSEGPTLFRAVAVR